MKSISEKNPDLITLDISISGNRLELIKNIRASHPSLPILVLSMHDGVAFTERVLKAGANGFLTKAKAAGVVVAAIRSILGGIKKVDED